MKPLPAADQISIDDVEGNRSDSEPPRKSSRWSRVIDKLIGEAPNVEQLGKLKRKVWLRKHYVSLVGLITALLVLVFPEVVSRINGVPDKEDFQTFNVRILLIRPTEPHLWVEMPDGTQKGLEWPVPLSGSKGGFQSAVLTKEQQREIEGCHAIVSGVDLKWTFTDRFRVWELECQASGVNVDIDRTSLGFNIWMDSRQIPIFVLFPLWFLFIAIVYFRERRGHI